MNKKDVLIFMSVFVIALFILFTLTNFNKLDNISGMAFKDAGSGVKIAYWGMSSNYPLKLGGNTLQTEVKLSKSTTTSLAAGYIVQDIATVITGYAGIAADVKVMLGGFVPDPVSVAITLSDKFTNYFRNSASTCLRKVAVKYVGGEANFVVGTTAEKKYSSIWKGNYIYSVNTYYTKSGSYICSEKSCAGFVYDNGKSTTSCL